MDKDKAEALVEEAKLWESGAFKGTGFYEVAPPMYNVLLAFADWLCDAGSEYYCYKENYYGDPQFFSAEEIVKEYLAWRQNGK